MDIRGSFDPAVIEAGLYEVWEREGHFAPRGNGAPYCIAIPPPNITDRLHIGHAFQHTLMDALIRYHRMNGRRALWQTGTDHAQIAT
ncbi:MAG: class I tRNA ligase family protein, partial [Gammaproteobacteria bacterium]|nr:class I tRNA ligase family protein [Gammaproteobacteria bacterium]